MFKLIFVNFEIFNFNSRYASIYSCLIEKLAGDLNSIFEFIEKLNELNTDKVEPLTSVAETTLKFRSDEVKSENIREQIIKNSPEDNEDFFVVPKVVE